MSRKRVEIHPRRTAGTAKAIRAANVVKPSGAVRLIKTLLVAGGALFFLITIAELLVVNFNFGTVILAAGSLILVLYGFLYEKLIKLKWLTSGLLTICVLVVFMMLALGIYGQADNAAYDEDAVIVLGAGIRGERVSLTLAKRLDRALEYLRENPEAVVVVTGARGPQEDITEALAMERYLIGRGAPAGQIIKEEAATNTYENLVYSKAILDRRFEEGYRAVIVTNEFHMFRAMKLAGDMEMDATRVHAKTVWYEIPRNFLRECVAVIKVLILGK